MTVGYGETYSTTFLRVNDPLTPCPPLNALLAVRACLAAGRGSEDLIVEHELPAPVTFYGPGLSAVLVAGRDAQCLLHLTQTQPAAAVATLHVLRQAVDDRGLPCGFTAVLLVSDIEFSTSIGGLPHAFVWLPAGLSFDAARNCYYRVATKTEMSA